MKELFAVAEERGLSSPGWEPYSVLIKEKTGTRIPTGSLKYWYYGYSTPKVSEIELMALALGYDLDLLLPVLGQRRQH